MAELHWEALERLGDIIARRAGRNFLVVALAAALSTSPDVLDPATSGTVKTTV
jgi:hypothetical protein